MMMMDGMPMDADPLRFFSGMRESQISDRSGSFFD